MPDDFQPPSDPPVRSTECYAAWREKAEIRLAEMKREYWQHKAAVRRLSDEIFELQCVMGNGASGGTAWTLHNDQAQARRAEH